MKQNRVLTQALKPFSIQTLYGTVETVPHKDFLVAKHGLQSVCLCLLLPSYKSCLALQNSKPDRLPITSLRVKSPSYWV